MTESDYPTPEMREESENLVRFVQKLGEIGEDLAKKRAPSIESLKEQGFIPLSERSLIYVAPDSDLGGIPTHFFSVDLGGGVEEHRIQFPMENMSSVLSAMKSLYALYDGQENGIVISRRGIKGFFNFVGKSIWQNKLKRKDIK